MEEIVYYPDCTDVFAIGDPGGISYYLIDKKIYKEKDIINISIKHKALQGKEYIYNNIENRNFDNMILSNDGNRIFEKVFRNKEIKPINIENTNKTGRYQIWSANKVSLVSNIPKSCLWSPDTGMFNCLGIQQIIDIEKGSHKEQLVPEDSRLIFTSNKLSECQSFVSWAYTRFVRYMLSLSLCGLTGIATSDTWWRAVPAPEAFDHIFTDQELYEKYNLTQEEIKIIESVIKERK